MSCHSNMEEAIEPLIIPKPLFQKNKNGFFTLDKEVHIVSDPVFSEVINYLTSHFKENYNHRFNQKKNTKTILFRIDKTINHEEGYELVVTKNKITVRSKSSKGAFYAVQTLLQLSTQVVPTDLDSSSFKIPCLEIKDEPRFSYRGMHLDVGRHFYSVAFIKKYIDLLSRLKMNTFHWHLTEDQGWRIEIKKYPKLQEIAAFRDETLVGHYNDLPHQFDGKRYGGFYTQEQIKEVVAYAEQRQVTIIPEIEMPGHSQAAIAAYPELGCTEKQVSVATQWGIFEEVYCPKENTFQFLEDVIDEVVALFPGKYIHIGGDEAPKTRWKNCDYCQKLIKKEGLKDEHGLQSYFIKRMEKYINSKGKQIIGWDEILEGGLAPNATVMSWRGTNGAVEAAQQGHHVILTPVSHCYFDYYQSDNENEPLAIGGFLPLEKVYHFNPIPKELSKEESKYVLGAQGNVWTEYMPTEKQVEYMAYPRTVALSEAVWSSPENKNFEDFVSRLEIYQKRLDMLDVNYANHLHEVKGTLISKNDSLFYELSSTSKNHDILYTTHDDEISKLYDQPIHVDTTMNLKAAVFDDNLIQLGNTFEQNINLHKAVGSKIKINKEAHPSYNSGGTQALINGISGHHKRYGDNEWLGFLGEDVEILIEFDKPTQINSIATRFYNGNGQWIYAPKTIEVSFDDDQHKMGSNINATDQIIVPFELKLQSMTVNSLRLKIPNYGVIPQGKQGAGHKAWTFIDEIIIE